MDNMNNGNVIGMIPQNYGYGPTTNQVTPVNCDQMMHITTLADLQSYACGTVVRFPDFSDGQPFVARVRRPSMLVLAKQGKIPNALLTAAGELFTKGGGGLDSDNENMLSDMYNIMAFICRFDVNCSVNLPTCL